MKKEETKKVLAIFITAMIFAVLFFLGEIYYLQGPGFRFPQMSRDTAIDYIQRSLPFLPVGFVVGVIVSLIYNRLRKSHSRFSSLLTILSISILIVGSGYCAFTAFIFWMFSGL